jgi:hypothetical protein
MDHVRVRTQEARAEINRQDAKDAKKRKRIKIKMGRFLLAMLFASPLIFSYLVFSWRSWRLGG